MPAGEGFSSPEAPLAASASSLLAPGLLAASCGLPAGCLQALGRGGAGRAGRGVSGHMSPPVSGANRRFRLPLSCTAKTSRHGLAQWGWGSQCGGARRCGGLTPCRLRRRRRCRPQPAPRAPPRRRPPPAATAGAWRRPCWTQRAPGAQPAVETASARARGDSLAALSSLRPPPE